MSNASLAFVFVHGAWHDASTWRLITPLLEARGHLERTSDLPGAGRNAKFPRTYGRRPLDPAAFATELSPNADVSQEDRNRAVVASIDEVMRHEDSPVVLVGHSLGGLTSPLLPSLKLSPNECPPSSILLPFFCRPV